MRNVRRLAVGALTTMLIGCGVQGQTQKDPLKGFRNPSEGFEVARQGMFFVNGDYYTSRVEKTTATCTAAPQPCQYMAGQMYVDYQIPRNVRHPYPIVMVHGAGQTGTNFLSTPDDRPGWAQFFLANGYAVYVVDQTGRGRSVYTTEVYGPTRPPFDVDGRVQNWSLQQESNLFPNAHLHTQWPGTGKPRDPFFDQFYASQVQLMLDPVKTQEYAQKALSALLDKIGPAILLTHSQSGTFGFLVADKRPDLVKGVVTVEGGGTPRGFTAVGPPRWFEDAPPPDVTWGIASIPLTYSPAAAEPRQLAFVAGVDAGSRKAGAVLGAGVARAPAPEPAADAPPPRGRRSQRCVQHESLRVPLPHAGWRSQHLGEPRGRRHPRQRPHDDAGEKQSGDRGVLGGLAGGQRRKGRAIDQLRIGAPGASMAAVVSRAE